MEAMGDTQFNSFQTGFFRRTDASHFPLLRQLPKTKTPLFLAQYDLKNAFDHVQHSFATTAFQQKGVSEQKISKLNKWWTQSNVEVSLAGIKSDIAFQRGLPQGAPEAPPIFGAVSDHVLITWTMDGGTEILGGN